MRSLLDKPLRLRDFIRVGKFYFSVVGYRNENSVKCFLRYAPGKGKRWKNGEEYKKLNHEEALKIGKRFYSEKEGIFRVGYGQIDEVFKPEKRLSKVMDREVKKVVEFFNGIPMEKMGVTGSRLIGLKGEESDVDFVMYGKYWFIGREKIKKGIERGILSDLDEGMWNFIYKKRKPALNYEAFVSHERRKYHRAFIGSTYFDLLYVRDYDEIDRDVPEEVGEKVGKAKIIAKLLDDSLIFDYPAYYPIRHDRIKAVLCFTHTYAGQVFKNEVLEAYGQIERIKGNHYLIVGTKREVEDEYIVSKTLLEKLSLGEYLR